MVNAINITNGTYIALSACNANVFSTYISNGSFTTHNGIFTQHNYNKTIPLQIKKAFEVATTFSSYCNNVINNALYFACLICIASGNNCTWSYKWCLVLLISLILSGINVLY